MNIGLRSCGLVLLVARCLSQAPAAAPPHLKPVQQVRAGVDMWPLLADASDTSSSLRINTVLTRYNARLFVAVRKCDAQYHEYLSDSGEDPNNRTPAAKVWTRRVSVTMVGPRYLSLTASDEIMCEGHADADRLALLFDLTTGEQLHWPALLSRGGVSELKDMTLDGSPSGAIVSPALRTMYLRSSTADCQEVFGEDQAAFLLWPDERQGRVFAVASGVPYRRQGCALPVGLSQEQAASLGVREAVLAAIYGSPTEVPAKADAPR